MVKVYAVWIVLGVLFLSGRAFPENEPAGSMEERIDEIKSLEKRIVELEQQQKILARKWEIEQQAAAEKAKASPVVTATSKDGFSLKSADGDFSLRFRGLIQADTRSVSGSSGSLADDTFTLRRVRPIFEGTLWKDIDFKIVPDFGGGSSSLQDAYLDFKFLPEFKVRAGRFKSPFGIERLQSCSDTLFNELGLPSNLTPNYDIGAAIFGDLYEGKLGYTLGVLNGAADNASIDSDIDNNKEVAARLFANPWKGEDSFLGGLGVGFAATYGIKDGTSGSTYLPTYKTIGQADLFKYASGVVSDGAQERYSPQLYYSYGSFGVLAEYITSSRKVSKAAATEKLTNKGWQVAASYVLTGEDATYKSVIPRKPVNFTEGSYGAWEVVARFGRLDIDSDTFPTYASSTSYPETATNIGAGLNWYWNRNVKWALDYDWTSFDKGSTKGDRKDEHAIIGRVQLTF